MEKPRVGESAAEVAGSIAELARREFAGHTCRKLGRGEWRCGVPGTVMSSFSIIIRPYYILVFGDMGDWILQVSDEDPLLWLADAVRSPDYLLGKVRVGEARRFYPAEALASLEREKAEGTAQPEVVEHVQDVLAEFGELSEYEWRRAHYEAGDADPATASFPSEGGLWLVEILRWFVAHVGEDRLKKEDS